MRRSIIPVVFVVSGVAAAAGLIAGCSKSADSRNSGPDGISRLVGGIETRVTSHDSTMRADTSRNGRREEMEHYRDDLEDMMGDLGDSVAMRGGCRMMMGGHMMGQMGADTTCPVQTAFGSVYDEYHRHFREMEEILGEYHQDAFDQEMATHLANMRRHMDGMMRDLDDEFGMSMMDGRGR